MGCQDMGRWNKRLLRQIEERMGQENEKEAEERQKKEEKFRTKNNKTGS